MQSVLNTYQNSTFSGSLTFGKSDLNARSNFLDEVKGEGNSYTTEFRQLDPRLGRWLSCDPKANEMLWQSPYCSMNNNPILFNDIKGDIVPILIYYGIMIAVDVAAYYAISETLEQREGPRQARQTGYVMQHPINTTKITKANDIAGDMSINLARSIGKELNKDGTPQNAIRHTLWNAFLTKSMGSKEAAKAATDSHETDVKIDWNQTTFANDDEADKSIDIRNNMIGRRIGDKNKGLSNVDIGRKVIEEYYKNGLWTSKMNRDGTHTISKTKLTNSEYKKALAELNLISSETGKHKESETGKKKV